jgi:hypothetical protein
VRRLVADLESRYPATTQNTYVCHPWCGWGPVSIDVWGGGGRGDPLDPRTGPIIRAYLMNLPGAPYIRHTIWDHWLWTSWGGYSWWSSDDHSGGLRHLHVTYWR